MTASIGPVFVALADDTRRAVLQAVASDGPTTATRLTAELPITRQAISKHLVVLQDAGLVASERHGRETVFNVVPGSLRATTDWMTTTDRAWSRRLGRLRDHLAERRG